MNFESIKKEIEASSCPICMDPLKNKEIFIGSCYHSYCLDCSKQIKICCICLKAKEKDSVLVDFFKLEEKYLGLAEEYDDLVTDNEVLHYENRCMLYENRRLKLELQEFQYQNKTLTKNIQEKLKKQIKECELKIKDCDLKLRQLVTNYEV